MDDFETHPVGTAARIAELEAALTSANAATAAAYEVAAKAVAEAHVFADDDTDGETVAKVITLGRAGKAVRALATPGQTAALDKLIAEAVKPYVEALRVLISHTHECERELTEALYHADFCGESKPLTDARAILAAVEPQPISKSADLHDSRDEVIARLVEAMEQFLIEYDEVDLAVHEPKSLTDAVYEARAALAAAKAVQHD